MLEISWSELLILAVVTLLFVGPKELPVFLRTIGRYAGMLRRQANEFKSHFDAAMREAELASMQEEMQKMQASVNAEIMGAEKAFKDVEQAGVIADPVVAQQPASFTAAAQAVVFPTPAPLGQVYVKPEPEPVAAVMDAAAESVPMPAPAAEMAHAHVSEPAAPSVKAES